MQQADQQAVSSLHSPAPPIHPPARLAPGQGQLRQRQPLRLGQLAVGCRRRQGALAMIARLEAWELHERQRGAQGSKQAAGAGLRSSPHEGPTTD